MNYPASSRSDLWTNAKAAAPRWGIIGHIGSSLDRHWRNGRGLLARERATRAAKAALKASPDSLTDGRGTLLRPVFKNEARSARP